MTSQTKYGHRIGDLQQGKRNKGTWAADLRPGAPSDGVCFRSSSFVVVVAVIVALGWDALVLCDKSSEIWPLGKVTSDKSNEIWPLGKVTCDKSTEIWPLAQVTCDKSNEIWPLGKVTCR